MPIYERQCMTCDRVIDSDQAEDRLLPCTVDACSGFTRRLWRSVNVNKQNLKDARG